MAINIYYCTWFGWVRSSEAAQLDGSGSGSLRDSSGGVRAATIWRAMAAGRPTSEMRGELGLAAGGGPRPLPIQGSPGPSGLGGRLPKQGEAAMSSTTPPGCSALSSVEVGA